MHTLRQSLKIFNFPLYPSHVRNFNSLSNIEFYPFQYLCRVLNISEVLNCVIFNGSFQHLAFNICQSRKKIAAKFYNEKKSA